MLHYILKSERKSENEDRNMKNHNFLPCRSIVEDLTNVTGKNATLTKGWKECNVILFPILVFGLFCLAVILVLIRYKVCANYDEEEKEEDSQEK